MVQDKRSYLYSKFKIYVNEGHVIYVHIHIVSKVSVSFYLENYSVCIHRVNGSMLVLDLAKEHSEINRTWPFNYSTANWLKILLKTSNSVVLSVLNICIPCTVHIYKISTRRWSLENSNSVEMRTLHLVLLSLSLTGNLKYNISQVYTVDHFISSMC